MLELLEELPPPFARMRRRYLRETELVAASVLLHSRRAVLLTHRRLCLFRRVWWRMTVTEAYLADIWSVNLEGKTIVVKTSDKEVGLDFHNRPDMQAPFWRLLENLLGTGSDPSSQR